MNCPYKILDVRKTDSLEIIKKKYRKLALKYHPDRNINVEFDDNKFKEINEAYKKIIDNHENDFMDDIYFQNFTEKIINKGKKFGDFFKNFKTENFKDVLLTEIKNYKKFYESHNTDVYSEDINVNINIDLQEIYNNIEKFIDLEIYDKCPHCIINDLKLCLHCNNSGKVLNKQKFVFNSADKIIIFPESAHYELNKKRGNINIRIITKLHNTYKIINNYDILYEIYINNEKDISIEYTLFNNDVRTFYAKYPYKKEYIYDNLGIHIPFSNKRGNLIIKVIKNIYI